MTFHHQNYMVFSISTDFSSDDSDDLYGFQTVHDSSLCLI